MQTMTLDRKMARVRAMDSNPYGTMARLNQTSRYQSITSIKSVNNLLSNMKTKDGDANITTKEERKYLKAVEAGDLIQVEDILSTAASNFLYSNEIIQHSKQNHVQDLGKGSHGSTSPGHDSKFTSWRKASTTASPAVSLTEVLPVPSPDRNKHSRHFVSTKPRSKFNKNCRDQWRRSALFIAMIHNNMEMMDLLLRHKVDVKECLYHAIDFGYHAVVDLFMKYDLDTSQMITEDDSFYFPGLTPLQLAAHKNDYVMLKILYAHGFRISSECIKREVSKGFNFFNDVGLSNVSRHLLLEQVWSRSSQQILLYKAVASPAYLVMTFLENLENDAEHNWDFLETLFCLYENLKRKASDEPTMRSLYMPLADQIEEFACDLLSEVRCPTDLADLLRFDPPGQPRSISQRAHLTPVQRAVQVRMKRFVAHPNSQLAISTLRLGTLFQSEHGWHTLKTRTLLACVYPFLCIAFCIAPESKAGRLLRNPIVNITCHVTSKLIFLLLMILRLMLLTMVYECDCLGMQIDIVDSILFLFVIGRILHEVKKIRESSLKQAFYNVWILNEIASSVLYIIVIILKIYDLARYNRIYTGECTNRNHTNDYMLNGIDYPFDQCDRVGWKYAQSLPVTISEAALAIIYLLIHVRAMELLYTHRTFGPLQLSVDSMFLDTLRFLTIFAGIFFAFALAMTQVYWAWGHPRRIQTDKNITFCEEEQNETNTDCLPVYSSIFNSLMEQYWTLYGYGWKKEPPTATVIPPANKNITGGYKGVTMITGHFLSMIFHGWAVVVMLNVLVAMMSHSFDRVRNNAELEWKFHKSGLWLKFIRKEICLKPPPMNLLPSTKDLLNFWKFLKNAIRKLRSPTRHDVSQKQKSKATTLDLKYRQAIIKVTQKYLRRRLLPDFNHSDIIQPVLVRSDLSRPSSTLGLTEEAVT